MTLPDSFLTGRLLDENGRPPLTAHFCVLGEGSVQGERGWVRVQGDHAVRPDGAFTSPALTAGRYYLRFSGILQGTAGPEDDKLNRVFDFIYPVATHLSEAVPSN